MEDSVIFFIWVFLILIVWNIILMVFGIGPWKSSNRDKSSGSGQNNSTGFWSNSGGSSGSDWDAFSGTGDSNDID